MTVVADHLDKQGSFDTLSDYEFDVKVLQSHGVEYKINEVQAAKRVIQCWCLVKQTPGLMKKTSTSPKLLQ